MRSLVKKKCGGDGSGEVDGIKAGLGRTDWYVRCVKGYSIVVLTGTDALPLDTSVHPLCQRLQCLALHPQ